MKSTVKNIMFASMLVASVSLASCKDKANDVDNAEVTDTTGTITSAPIADTVVKKDGDTIIETGTKNDTKENPVGTQVP